MPVSPDLPSDVPDSAAPDISVRKAAVRAEILAARRALPSEVLSRHAARVAAVLRDVLPELLTATRADQHRAAATRTDQARGGADLVVAGYAPFGAEPGGPGLPDTLRGILGPRARLLLPVLRDDRDLDWAAYTGILGAAGGRHSEPPGARLGRAAVAAASLVVAPAVAVDRLGVRLGRGGGSYDRALARVPAGVPIVALLHDGELRQEDLPAEPHDRRVTAVITPGDGLVAMLR